MRKVPRCVVDEDRREVMGLLRTESTKRREAGLANKNAAGNTTTATAMTAKTTKDADASDELTLLQGACLQGSSFDMVALLLINGAWPDVTTPVVPCLQGNVAKGGNKRGTRHLCGGYTPLHLALIGGGRDRNKIVKELLIYGADVNIKDAEGFSFEDLTASETAYAGLRPFIAAASKDPRAKKAQEAGRAMRDLRQIAEQRAMERVKAEHDDSGDKREWTDPLENLPPELCIHIFSFLSIAQLSRACLVSTLWCCVATDHDLWRRLYIAQVGPVPASAEFNFQGLIQRGLKLKAELAAREKRSQMQQAKLLFQIVTHPHCDHKHHDQQIDVTRVNNWQYRKRYLACGSSMGVSLDMRTQALRISPTGYNTINIHLEQDVVRANHSEDECKIRCSNRDGKRKVYPLKVGDKLSVLQFLPHSGSCRVFFFSLTLDVERDHLVPANLFHCYNRV